jgi:iron-sulfur cluster assembly accessory protein
MNVTITEKAKSEIKRIIQEQFANEPKTYLRLRVLGGGCAGYIHKLDLTPDITDRDSTMIVEDIDVVIDKRSALYLDGVTVDFHDDINNRGFSVKNPSMKSSCGCGKSVSF